MIGALISGASTIIGGLFGRKKKETTETTVDYVKMAQNAEAAGFNPLTALRNGGSAGFTSTVHHPGLSGVGDAISQFGSAFGAALDRRLDPIEQKRSKVENALLDYQLETIQSRPKAPMMFGNVPTRGSSGLVSQHMPPLSYKKKPAPVTSTVPGRFNGSAKPDTKLEAGDAPTVTSAALEDRLGVHPDQGVADAAVWEQRYGEPGSWIGGLYVMGNDALNSINRHVPSGYKQYFDAVTQPVFDKRNIYRRAYSKFKGAEPPRGVLGNLPLGQPHPIPGFANAPKTSW